MANMDVDQIQQFDTEMSSWEYEVVRLVVEALHFERYIFIVEAPLSLRSRILAL